MSMINATKNKDGAAPGGRPLMRLFGRLLRLLLALAVLGVAAGVSLYWMTHRPTAQRHPPQQEARLVEVSRVQAGTQTVFVDAMGTVVPARTVALAGEVGGRVVEVHEHFVPGGWFGAGEQILRIEPRDYELVVEQRESDLAKAEHDLRLEMGSQSVAQREYELLGQEVQDEDRELLLRRPQLAKAEAVVASARAALEQARLSLRRTAVVAPFNCMVRSRSVELGSQVSMGTALASLVGTDEYWIEVSVPADELRWLRVPGFNDERGSAVEVSHEAAWGRDVRRIGTVICLMGELEPEGRMARLLVSVTDPLARSVATGSRSSLILGSYVRVHIEGRDLPGVVPVPRASLRDGDQVWVMADDGSLDIRDVAIAWQGPEDVYASEGLADGEMLVTSDLAAPVAGMALRTPGSTAPHPRVKAAPQGDPETGEADHAE